MLITVAVCTWNRSRLLDQTLTRMRDLRIPDGVDWELLVVNNNCTDNTDEVIASHAEHLPVRRLFEPTPGQTNARNCATTAAKGELIVWTDDDVLVDADWLSGYSQALDQWPSVSFFGGPILPWFEATPPKWLDEVWGEVADAYATRDLGNEPIEFTDRIVPFGANFAVRTEVQRQYPYDPNLGLKPNGCLRGDETTVIRQMLADGLKGRWIPGANVRHFIPKERQTIGYVRRTFFGFGQFMARALDSPNVPMLFGRPRWLWKRAVEDEMKYRFRRLFCKPQIWVKDLVRSSLQWGQLRAYDCAEPEETTSGDV